MVHPRVCSVPELECKLMYITKVTSRYKNDFKFDAYCRHCDKYSHWPDGYADDYYQEVVFPHRYCPYCGKDEYGTEVQQSENIK